MQITGTNGAKLNINVKAATATWEIDVNNGPKVVLNVDIVNAMLPSLSSAKVALEEAEITRRKMRLDDLRQQIVDIQAEIDAIEKL